MEPPKIQREIGFGKTDDGQQRLMNHDGSYNVRRRGLTFFEQFNFFHYFINISWLRFLMFIFAFYTILNIIFTSIYFLIGTNQLTGLIYETPFQRFVEVYLHSAQTLTTVGYGRISPVGVGANLVSSFEALLGLLSFALITGLIYGRFSKPVPRIKFSNNAIFAPYQDGYALMFRLANQIESNLMNSRVRVSLGISEKNADGTPKRSFYGLSLERDEIAFFPTTWTVVHHVNEESPFWGLSESDLAQAHPEVFILYSSFEDTFDQTIHVRVSYAYEDMRFGVKFSKMLQVDKYGVQEADLSKISELENAILPNFPKN